MTRRWAVGLLRLMAVIVVVSSSSVLPAAEAERGVDAWSPAVTVDGQPDLQGVWANNSATPLERPEGLEDRAQLTEEEVAALQRTTTELFEQAGDAAFGDTVFRVALTGDAKYTSRDGGTGNYSFVWMADREFDGRTSLIVDPPDGRLPELTPDAQARVVEARAARMRPAAGPEDRSLGERCITFGVPRTGAGYNSYYQIVQTPGYVAILMEMIHDVRIIPLDGRAHLDNGIRQWHGDSRGRWEGQTLVVDTTNYSPKSSFRGAREGLHVIERFTRVGPETLEYEITIEDPSTWTDSWTAMIPLKKTQDAIYEYACHEGNYGLAGILAGARAQENLIEEAGGD